MIVIDTPVPLAALAEMARSSFGDLVKAVVDVEKGIMAVGGELHADEEALLLESGSRQSDLWGVNIYPELQGPDRIEFDSVINIRPRQGNRSRGIEDEGVRVRVRAVAESLILP